MIVNKHKYYYKKLLKSTNNSINKTVEISDKAAEELGLKEVEVNPDIPELPDDPEDVDWSKEYLTFETLEDGTFSFTKNALYYSINNGKSWISLAEETQTQLIPAGTKVLWKTDGSMKSSVDKGIGTFSSTGKFNVMGNILSLIYDNFINIEIINSSSNFYKQCFRYLFSSCKNIISAKHLILPIKDLTNLSYYGSYTYSTSTGGAYADEYTSIYYGMFYNCSNLIYAPDLPATILTPYCYNSMFSDCKSLITAPELPATILANNCYSNMFYNCSSLNYIKMMATDVSADECLRGWVSNVSKSGTFVKSKDLVFNNIGTSGIPAGWEVIEE